MSGCICSRCGTNVAPLGVADYNQALFVAVIHCLLIYNKAFYAKLLIHGNLRLNGRNQVPCMVNDFLIKFPDGLCSAFQGLAVGVKGFLHHMLRHIGQHRIKSDTDGGIGLFYLFNQLANHSFLLMYGY